MCNAFVGEILDWYAKYSIELNEKFRQMKTFRNKRTNEKKKKKIVSKQNARIRISIYADNRRQDKTDTQSVINIVCLLWYVLSSCAFIFLFYFIRKYTIGSIFFFVGVVQSRHKHIFVRITFGLHITFSFLRRFYFFFVALGFYGSGKMWIIDQVLGCW